MLRVARDAEFAEEVYVFSFPASQRKGKISGRLCVLCVSAVSKIKSQFTFKVGVYLSLPDI